MPKVKRMPRNIAYCGEAYKFSHSEWEKFSDWAAMVTFLAKIFGIAAPFASVLAALGTPYFLLAKYKEKKWGKRGIVFLYISYYPNEGKFPTFHSPDIWSELTPPEWIKVKR